MKPFLEQKDLIMAKTISCLTIIATAAKILNERDPVSPINILAGGALNQKARHEPTYTQKTEISPTSGMYCNCKYSEKIVFPNYVTDQSK